MNLKIKLENRTEILKADEVVIALGFSQYILSYKIKNKWYSITLNPDDGHAKIKKIEFLA